MFEECLIVTEVKCLVVKGPSPFIVESYRNPRKWLTLQECKESNVYPGYDVKTEQIYPREFIDPMTQQRKWIGMTKDVYDKLKMPYDAIESLEGYVSSLRQKESTLLGRIKEAKRYLATRWKSVDGARKKLNYYQGRFCTYHQLNDRVRKFEKMTVWQFMKYKLGATQ